MEAVVQGMGAVNIAGELFKHIQKAFRQSFLQ